MFEDFTKRIRVTRQAAADPHTTIAGYPHYLPLSMLGADFWTEMGQSPSFRVTDGLMNELPIHVVDLDVPNQRGTLWIKDDKADTAKAYWIHYASPTSIGFDSPTSTWSAFNEAIMLNEDLAAGQVINSVNGTIGTPYSNDGTFVGTQVDSLLEMKATRFFDTKDHLVHFGAGTYDVTFYPMTFIFLFKLVEIPAGIEHMFGNWRNFAGQQPYRVVITPDQLGIQLGELGFINGHFTDVDQFSDIATDTWFLGVVCHNFDLGIVEIDINRINRTLSWNQAGPIWDNEAAIRPVGGLGSDSSNMILSNLLTYRGYLDQGQRNAFYDNFFAPQEFWRVMFAGGAGVTISSPIEKNICLSSQQQTNFCFSSPIRR